MKRIVQVPILCLFSFFIAVAPARGQHFSDWSTPVNLLPVVNSTTGDFFSAVSKDGLSLYFTSARTRPPDKLTADWDIYVSKRECDTCSWGTPVPLGPEINTVANEGGPTLSNDGHRMYFASTRPGGFGGNDIYVSSRRKKDVDIGDGGWETPQNLGPVVNTTANETNPSIFEDEITGVRVLYFDSNRQTGIPGFGPYTDDAVQNGNDIYESFLLPDGTFAGTHLVTELSTASADRQPSIRKDGLEVFLASDWPGGLGLLDVWVSTRATIFHSWGTPVNVTSVNSTVNDAGPELSFHGETLYLHKNPSPGEAFDLYVTTRSKLKGKDKN